MPRLQVVAVSLFAFLMALLWPYAVRAQNAPAQPPAVNDEAMVQAKQHFEAGRNAYNAGDYGTAIREFKAAEALRPSPILNYNIGLANEKLNKKRVALKYYRRYLEQMPTAGNRGEVEGRIAQLEQDIAAQPPPPPSADPNQPPPPGAEQPGDMPPPQTAPPPPGYDPYASAAPPPGTPVAAHPPKKKSYWWVWLLVAGGGALLIAVIVAVAVVETQTYNSYSSSSSFLVSPRDPAVYNRRTMSTFPLFRF
jgi:tetratricopeptide (TPR) repeat protein